MAQSMFNEERKTRATNKTWRAAVVGAAVPFAIFAAAPGVSAAGADPVEAAPVQTVESEQLALPGGLPDPTALLDLQACLTELQGLIAQLPPPPVEPPVDPPVEPPVAPPVESEQLPGAPAVPDIGALTEVCKQVVEVVKGLIPPVEPPVDPGLPVEPPIEPPVDPLPVPAN